VGCNVENSSYGMTNCAERTAIFAAIAKDGPELEISAVAVVNDHGVPCSPCGACRQRMREFAGEDAKIHIAGTTGVRATFTLGALLPEAFGPSMTKAGQP